MSLILGDIYPYALFITRLDERKNRKRQERVEPGQSSGDLNLGAIAGDIVRLGAVTLIRW